MPADKQRHGEGSAKTAAAGVAMGEPVAARSGSFDDVETCLRPYRAPEPEEPFDSSHLSEIGEIPVAVYGLHFDPARRVVSGEAMPAQPAQLADVPMVPVVWDLTGGAEIVVEEQPEGEIVKRITRGATAGPKRPPFARRCDGGHVVGPGRKASKPKKS
jgi:hypothetical protein